MGTRLPFCIRRGAMFYCRRRLPSPSKMSVEFSLGTKDERIARGLSGKSPHADIQPRPTFVAARLHNRTRRGRKLRRISG